MQIMLIQLYKSQKFIKQERDDQKQNNVNQS